MLIRVAFCFDENLVNQVQATAASLLDARHDLDVHYEIYCICTKAAAIVEEHLRNVVAARDKESVLIMKVIENPYQNAYEIRQISSGAYLRLVLHRILPEVDKIIYTDIDVLFRDDLRSIWQTDINGYVLAAVAGPVNLPDQWEWNSQRDYWKHLSDLKGKYVNSGVLFLNLEEIRKRNLEEQWNLWAQEKLHYQDQDILNITCKGSICYLPLKYNVFAYMIKEYYDVAIAEHIYTQEEYREAMEHPVILHYAADKPWKRYDTNMGNLWWDYVNSQPDLTGLFDEEKARKYHGITFWQRVVRKIKKIVRGEKW